MCGRGGGWSFDLEIENSTKLVVAGTFFLLVSGGLTLWSYIQRDPVSGQYFIWYRGLISGTVLTVAGLIWRYKENDPII
jgi:hypothetical protein